MNGFEPREEPFPDHQRGVDVASAQLAEAEALLAEHNEALRAWSEFLVGIQTELAATEMRERDTRAEVAALRARVEQLEGALSSLVRRLVARG